VTCRPDRKPLASSSDNEEGKPARKQRTTIPNKVFVGGVPSGVTGDDVNDFFSTVGDVIQAEKLISSRPRKGGDNWIIEFENSDGASEAISRLNGEEFQGSTILVREFRD
jgi:RNA recognition motif-containing protein